MKTKVLGYILMIILFSFYSTNGDCGIKHNIDIYLQRTQHWYYNVECNYNNIENSVKASFWRGSFKIIISSSNIVYFSSKTVDANRPVYYLKIQNSSLSTIEKGAFLSYPDLQEIHFPQNNLTNIEIGVFKALSYLKVLNLTRNLIETVEDNAFESLVSLKSMDLSENRLKRISSKYFVGLSSLESLNISENTVYNIEAMAFNGTRLRYIDLSVNALRVIATNFTKDLRTVEIANFSFNSIKALEVDNLDTLLNLATLDLSHNLIEALPVGYFGHLKSLEHLIISYNSITTLELGTFVGLANLKFLDLSHNKIATIPTIVFHNTPQLLSLDVSNNSITDIDSLKLKEFTTLRTININNNFFDCNTLSGIIARLKSLHIEIVYGTTKKLTGIHGVICRMEVNTPQTLSNYRTARPETMTSNIANGNKLPEELINFLETNAQLMNETLREIILALKKTSDNNSSVQMTKYLELQNQAFKDAVQDIKKTAIDDLESQRSLINATTTQIQNYFNLNAELMKNAIQEIQHAVNKNIEDSRNNQTNEYNLSNNYKQMNDIIKLLRDVVEKNNDGQLKQFGYSQQNSIDSIDEKLFRILNETVIKNTKTMANMNAVTIVILMCLIAIVILLAIKSFRKTKVFKNRHFSARSSNNEEQIML